MNGAWFRLFLTMRLVGTLLFWAPLYVLAWLFTRRGAPVAATVLVAVGLVVFLQLGGLHAGSLP